MTVRQPAAGGSARARRAVAGWVVGIAALLLGGLVAPLVAPPIAPFFDAPFFEPSTARAQSAPGPNSVEAASTNGASNGSTNGSANGSANGISPARPLREIHVPRKRLEEWLATGGWTPIGADDYARLKAMGRVVAEAPAPTRIEQADYEATFVDRALRNGSLTWKMVRTVPRPAPHPLEPHSFALTELIWDKPAWDKPARDKPARDKTDAASDRAPPPHADLSPSEKSALEKSAGAAWGADSEGRTHVLVDRVRGTLRGRWSEAGRKLGRGASFELSLPPAASSTLMLRVPAGFRIVASAADVRGPQPDARAGWMLWHVALGGRNQTRLDIVADDEVDVASERPLVQCDVLWDVREDGLRFAGAFEIESGLGAARPLEFEMPADLTVHRVTSGNDARLAWTARLDGERQRIVIPAGDLPRGRARTGRFEATAPIRLNERWPLPRVDLVDGVFVEGRAALRVESPLELRSLAPRGLIQTGVAIDDVQAESAQFRQDVAAAELAVQLGYPSPALATRTLSELTRLDDHWVCRSDVEWRAVAASTFQVAADFPRDWDVLEVRANAEKENRFKWDVVRGEAGRRRLVLEFAEPLTPAAPRLATVVLRQLGSASEATLDLPVLRPEGAAPRHAVLIPAEAGGPADAALSGKAATEALREFERFPLAADARKRGGPAPRVVLWNQTDGAEALRWREAAHAVRGRAWVTVDLASTPVRESIVCQIDPAGRAFDKVHVWLSGSFQDGPRPWMLVDEERDVAAERLPAARHADWGLPVDGELWRLTLPTARTLPFRLRVEGVLARSPLFSPALAFVPEAAQFAGHVQVNSSPDRRFDLQARGLLPLTVPAANAERERLGLPPAVVNRAWRYESPADRLQISAASDAAAPPATLQCRLHSAFADGAGDDLHTAHFRQCGGRPEPSVEFHLPAPARLIAARVEGRVVAVRPALLAGGDPGAFIVAIPEGGVWKRLVVEYATPGRAAGLWLTRDVVLPRLDRQTIDFRWTFSVPAGARPERVVAEPFETTPVAAEEIPSGLAWVVRSRPLSWRERLFGPFGRHDGEPVFDPLHPLASFTPAADDKARSPGDEATYALAGAAAPSSVRLIAGRVAVARTLGLALLLTTVLVGLLLRRRGAAARGVAAAAALVVSMIAAFLFSETIGVVAGGMFCGVLLTMIVPRRLIAPADPTRPRRADVPSGSTATLHRAVVGAALLAAAGLAVSSLVAIPAQSADDDLALDAKTDATTDARSGESAEDERAGPRRASEIPERDQAETGRGARPRVPSRLAGGETIDVLIPYDGEPTVPAAVPKTTPRAVYVPNEVARVLRARGGASAETTALVRLISSEARAGDDQVRATLRFAVVLLGRGEPARVALGLRDFAPADGDACRVDGEPVPLRHDDKLGYSIELGRRAATANSGADTPRAETDRTDLENTSATTTHLVEIVGFARVRFDTATGERSAALDLPPGPSSPIAWVFAAHVAVLEPRAARSESTGSESNRAENGGAQTVRWDDRRPPAVVRWHSAVGNPAPRTELELRLSRFVEVAPSSLEIHNRIAVKVLRGALDDVSWPLPEGVIVQKVVGDAVHSWSISTPPAGVRRLSVEFARPQTSEFRIDAVFLVPVAPDRPAQVEPWDIESADDARLTTRLVLRQVALTPRSGYRLNAPVVESETTRSITIDAFVRGAEWDEARRAAAAWQFYESAAIPVTLTPLVPKKTVRTAQETILSPRDALVRLRGEVATSEATDFRHVLRVDARIQIESISVSEDQADRLARWTRDGDRLVVTLDAGTTGTQDFTLVGRMPLANPSELTLPLPRFEDATVAEARLTISASPELEATIVEPGPLVAAANETPAGRLAPADALDGGARLVGRFTISGDGEPKLRVARVADRARVEIVSTIALEKNQTLWSAALRFTGLRGPDDARLTLRGIDRGSLKVRATPEVKFFIGPEPVRPPADGAPTPVVERPNGASGVETSTGEPSVRIEFPELPDDHEELRVELTAVLPTPSERMDQPVANAPSVVGRGPPLPSVESASRVAGHWFVAPRSQPWTLAREAAVVASVEELPAWHARPALEADLAPPVYRLDATPRRLELRASTVREAPEILAARTEIFWPDGQPPFARTLWRLAPRGAPLTLAMPPGTSLRRLLADGEPLAVALGEDGRSRAPLPVDQKPMLLEADWLPAPRPLPRFGPHELAAPVLDASLASPHAVVLRAPRHHPVTLVAPLKPSPLAEVLGFGRSLESVELWIEGNSPLAAALDRRGATEGDVEDAGVALILDSVRPTTDLRKNDLGAAPVTVVLRTFDARLERIPLLFVGAAAVGFAARWLLRAGVVAWVHRRRSAAAAALGLLWWLAFQFSPLGFILFAGSLVHAIVQVVRPREIHV